MRAALVRLHSPDVDDLRCWVPEGDFGILVQLIVGPEGERGEESFDITLCTSGWLSQLVREMGIVDARHYVIVNTYNYDEVERYLTRRVSACEGPSWDGVADKVGRLGHWEFEDYRE